MHRTKSDCQHSYCFCVWICEGSGKRICLAFYIHVHVCVSVASLSTLQTFQSFVFREDYLRASRALLREVVRALRHDIDFVALCRGFMKERTESQFRDLEATIKV